MAKNITVVNSASDEPVSRQAVPDGTTYQQVLELNKINTTNMVVKVRLDGQELDWDADEEVTDGVKLTVTPTQIKGA